ncbi:TatD family hydrolase, partial [bacterium]|nr:TatD family hydrolase [bacterium]
AWAKKFLDLGFYLGIGGLVTLPKVTDVHEVAAQVPGDRWLLETDGPYLAPLPYRGYRNESCLLPLIVERVAELRQTSPSILVQESTRNALRLFSPRSK